MANVNVIMESLDDGSFVVRFTVQVSGNSYFPITQVGCQNIQTLVGKVTDFLHETEGLNDYIIGERLKVAIENSSKVGRDKESRDALDYWTKELEMSQKTLNEQINALNDTAKISEDSEK